MTPSLVDSKGNPRCITNSRGRKRRPGTRELSSAVKTNDVLFLNFLKQCLNWDPMSRLSPEEALQHEWILEVHAHTCSLQQKVNLSLSFVHTHRVITAAQEASLGQFISLPVLEAVISALFITPLTHTSMDTPQRGT